MSDMLRQRRTLIEALYAKTLSGEIDWVDGIFSNGYSVEIGEKIIVITKESDEDTIAIILTIYDNAYNVIENFTDNYFSGFKPNRIPPYTYYQAMNELYDMARRHSTGATKAVNEILGTLGTDLIDDDGDIPF